MLSLIPISDAKPTKTFPIVTIALIAINIGVFFFVQPGFGTSSEATDYFYDNAPVPCQLEDCPDVNITIVDAQDQEIGEIALGEEPTIGEFLTRILYSTFFHGGFLHIAGNMLFLWVFGNNIEDFLGRVKYVLFYLVGGIVAGLAHILWTLRLDPMSENAVGACLSSNVTEGCAAIGQYVPAVGASGAVAAVMGAYLVLYPRHKVNVLVPIVIIWTVIQMSAFIVLGLWFLYQFLIGGPDIAGVGGGGVAWMAHVGGFVFGAVGILLLGGRPQRPHHHFMNPGWR